MAPPKDDSFSEDNGHVRRRPVVSSSEATAVTDNTTRSKEADMKRNATVPSSSTILNWKSLVASLAVWTLMMTVPLLLSSRYSPTSYQAMFPASWYEDDPSAVATHYEHYPGYYYDKPLGLTLGIAAVFVGQVVVWIFFYLFKFGYLSTGGGEPVSVQAQGARTYDFWEGLRTHVAQPEGFVLLMGYLTVTWMLNLMPPSYYSFAGTIQLPQLAACWMVQDALQFVLHLLEHVASPAFYIRSHKPHHRFTNPRLFDAFNGSLTDTFCMIVLPLFGTAHIVRTCNVWTYMAFGSSYAAWLTLIHSEMPLPWDGLFRSLGLGTAADHHVHHKYFKYNYGHLFMWWDMLAGTYRDPKTFVGPKGFSPNV